MQAQSAAEEEAEGESELDGQLLQEVSETLYLPALQALQVTPPASLLPVWPDRHVHALSCVLPCGEFVPAGQVLQVAAPADVLYLPAEQMPHVWPSGPEYPALQRQSEWLMLALGEEE